MSPPTKKDLRKHGRGYGYEPEDAQFLKNDISAWDASASQHGYNSRFDDDTGHLRGAQSGDGYEAEFLRPSTQGSDSPAHNRTFGHAMGDTISWTEGETKDPKTRELVGGSGAVRGGAGPGGPRYRPKTSQPQHNVGQRDPKGVR